MTATEPRLRIGTRGSALALAQAHTVRRLLAQAHGWPEEGPDSPLEIVAMTTTGDQVQSKALLEIGGKGLFTKEIEDALLDGSVDLAVHSMKDMPTKLPPGLDMAAILEREDPRDVFIGHEATGIQDLPKGAMVGTASLRRRAQVLLRRPDLEVVTFRGNVQTRLKKLGEGVVAGTLLARAGLNRLGLEPENAVTLSFEEMLPAVAQGAIGIEIRQDDAKTREAIAPLNDPATAACVTAERAFLTVLDGSCRTPIAGHAELAHGGRLRFRGLVLTPDGAKHWRTESQSVIDDAVRMGREAGEELRAQIEGDGIDIAKDLGAVPAGPTL